MTIYGILCGYTDFVNIADFLSVYEDYFINLLNLENGIPSHNTFSNVFRNIDSKKFIKLFIDWMKEIIKQKGTHLTIDAIGTQKNIVDKIVNEKKVHYCLSVKNNQKSLFYDIDEYFKFALYDKIELSKLKYHSSFNKDYGKIEKCECFVCNDINFLNDKDKWCNIKVIALVRNYREEHDHFSIDDRYYISDLDLFASDLSDIVRKHWTIENNLHWVLDVHFREDLTLSKKTILFPTFLLFVSFAIISLNSMIIYHISQLKGD